jgi:hypothetical protein
VIEVPAVGRMQMMKDPQGVAFYIYEPASAEQQPEAAAEVGVTPSLGRRPEQEVDILRPRP